MSPFRMEFPLIFDDPDTTRARLADLGLTLELVTECIIDGHLSRAACTVYDPPSFPGQTLWAVVTRSLRMRLAKAGWEKSDTGNYSIVINPTKTHAIVVATGDDGTGVRHAGGRLTTKCPKGPATVLAVQANQDQIDLFAPAEPVRVLTASDKGPLTWVLLLRHTGDRVFAELSLPLVMDVNEETNTGWIRSWHERIILPVIGGSEGPDLLRVPEPGPSIDVTVTRRTG